MSTAGASTNVGTTATSIGDFTSVLLDINPTYTTTGYPSVWTQFTVTVTGVASPTSGRLAFRYFVENGGPTGANSDYIGIDTFSYSGVCGPTPTPTATPTGTVTPTATATATPTATATATPGGGCGENFDGVTAPALPAGWTSAATGVEVPWVTSTTSPSSAPNAAFAPDPNAVGNTELISPAYTIAAGGGSFSFRNNFDVENTFDGMVLEISINGGAYQDIVAAGGTFGTGGYTGTISVNFMSPIAGRMAWTGTSGGYITTTVNLPAAANGQSIRLKWRMATDSSVAGVGVRVDTITGIPCGGATPTPTATPTATGTPTATPTGTPGPTLVTFSSATYTQDESQVASIGLIRTGNTTGTSTVTFATSNGTATGGASCTVGIDYVSVNQTVTFAPGETTKTVFVSLCADGMVENAFETINLTLTGPDTRPSEAPEVQTAVLRINDTATAFRNGGAICTTLGLPADVYPSTITVTGGPAQIGGIRITLYDFWHELPDNVDVLLVGPAGQKYVLMGDAGGALPIAQANAVTLTFRDVQPQVLPNNGPLVTGVFEPTTWETPVTSFPVPAPPAPYVEPGSAVGGPINTTMFGTFGLTNANGTWALYVRDDAGALIAINGCFDGGWGLEFLAPTAASASISGRVTTADGLGIRNAEMVLTGNSLEEPMRVTTSSFGYFTFEGLQAGETYIVTVNSRRYTFQQPSQVISLVDNAVDVNFTASPTNAP